MKQNTAEQACAYIQNSVQNFRPVLGIELGSGLGDFANHIDNPIVIPYSELPGFPSSEVEGHQNELILGTIHGVPLACLRGRIHLYEGAQNILGMKTMIRTLRLLGCETLLATNAAGSFHEAIGPGSLVAIKDHINFSGFNPLIGPNDDAFGPRFVAMDDVYDKQHRQTLQRCAKHCGIALPEGVYFGVSGPCFETPAEIRAYRLLGADVVGMSTVPNVIIAKHCGLRIIAISSITNLTADLHVGSLSHETTLIHSKHASEKLITLVSEFIKKLGQE